MILENIIKLQLPPVLLEPYDSCYKAGGGQALFSQEHLICFSVL